MTSLGGAGGIQGSPEQALLVLNGLAVATKTYRLYTNPLEQAAFGRAMHLVREGLATGSFIRMHVLPDRFSISGEEFGLTHVAVSELASWLFQRGVTELHIRGEPRPSELVAFAELVSTEEQAVQAQGGPKAFLTQRETSAIHVVDRKLAVGEFTPLALESVPDRLRSLLENQLALASELSARGSPQEAYERLRELLQAGSGLGVDTNRLTAGIADVVASMETAFRADLLEIAIGALPDEFASTVVSQLSDGEIAESLLGLSAKRPIDLVMTLAHEVVAHSDGRRAELPIIVGKRLLEIGFDSQRVNEAFAPQKDSRELGALVQTMPADALKLEDAEAELGLDELRAEARAPVAEVNEEAGIATLRGVLRSSDYEEDFNETLGLVAEAIERAISESQRDRYTRLIQLLASEASDNADDSRRTRVEDSLARVASVELVGDLLKLPGADSDPSTSQILESLGGRVVPALVTHLAEEVDRSRRKVLIEMLVMTASNNPGPVIEGLNDPRWYVVRNFGLILGRIRSPEAVPALEKMMQHNDPRVRREAVRAGAATQGADALPRLVQALSDRDEVVRLQSIAAIGAIQAPASTDALIQFASRRTRSVPEMKEVLTSLRLQRSEAATAYLKKTAQRRWPPTAATRQLAKFAKELLARSVSAGSPEASEF